MVCLSGSVSSTEKILIFQYSIEDKIDLTSFVKIYDLENVLAPMWFTALISYFSASLDVLGVNVVRPHSSTVHLDLCPRVHLARNSISSTSVFLPFYGIYSNILVIKGFPCLVRF